MKLFILSVLLIFVISVSSATTSSGISAITWKPKLWIPKSMQESVTVYILSEEDFTAAAFVRGIDPKKGGFSVLNKNIIYLKPSTLNLFPHEVRHLQEGHFHD